MNVPLIMEDVNKIVTILMVALTVLAIEVIPWTITENLALVCLILNEIFITIML